MLKNILTKAFLTLGLAAASAAAALGAQQTTTPAPQDAPRGEQQQQEGVGRWGGRGRLRALRRRALGFRALHELNLTDAQKQQMRAIRERYAQSLRPGREELLGLARQRRGGATLTPEQQARFDALRSELRDSMQRVRQEMLGVLTPEQRTRLEQLKQEHKARRQELRERFRQRRLERQQGQSGN